jgi:hypothetical protein
MDELRVEKRTKYMEKLTDFITDPIIIIGGGKCLKVYSRSHLFGTFKELRVLLVLKHCDRKDVIDELLSFQMKMYCHMIDRC